MEIKITNYKNQSSLISSIIFFILGGILFTNPDIFVTTISKIVGAALLLIAIVFMITTFINRKTKPFPVITITSIIIIILLSIMFLFFSETVEKIIRIVVGFWILFSGITKLINALKITNKNKKFISLIIVSLLLIIIGIYTIVIGDVLLSSIGIILMIYSALDIIGYIFYSKDSEEIVEINKETTLITDGSEVKEENKKRRKAKKIKDVSNIEEEK